MSLFGRGGFNTLVFFFFFSSRLLLPSIIASIATYPSRIIRTLLSAVPNPRPQLDQRQLERNRTVVRDQPWPSCYLIRLTQHAA
ncbi:hypothetical protein GGR54DRAFT_43625 [Hypoxylon sp. NC1633]|nr:hypothetical protein GGR54DRAFT_43625 [Hypoxylon sp. NC1633]